MRRRFDHDGTTWEVELSGIGGEGCGAHTLDVVFTCPSTGEAVSGEVIVSGTGRLTDAVLESALVVARAES